MTTGKLPPPFFFFVSSLLADAFQLPTESTTSRCIPVIAQPIKKKKKKKKDPSLDSSCAKPFFGTAAENVVEMSIA